MCQNRITLQLLLLFPVHCITKRAIFSKVLPIMNRPNITAVFMRCMIQWSVLNQCTDFRVSYTSYDNGCFSAVNRVLYSDNCHLKCHGNSVEFQYGWNLINAHRNKVFPRSCLLCSSCLFWLGFIQEFHHSVARVLALRDCSCQIDAKANENMGIDLKPATILQNGSLWNTQTCKFVATWHGPPKHHKCDPVYFRFFVTATENGTFSTINISKTIAGATGGDRSKWKSNK